MCMCAIYLMNACAIGDLLFRGAGGSPRGGARSACAARRRWTAARPGCGPGVGPGRWALGAFARLFIMLVALQLALAVWSDYALQSAKG